MEKILSIQELKEEVYGMPNYQTGLGLSDMIGMLSGGASYDGYKITTTEQEIYMVISNTQSCCESFGYFWSNDNVQEFVDTELINIAVTDEQYEKSILEKRDITLYEGGAVFVDIITNKGVLQFTIYNEHNGYYGHSVKIVSNQLKLDTVI